MSNRNATFNVEVNVGAVTTLSRNTTANAEINIGFAPLVASTSALARSELNVGFEPPPQQNVEQPQRGWGACLIPKRETVLKPQQTTAIFQAHVEVT